MKTATIANLPQASIEDEHTGLSKEALKRAFLDNLLLYSGKVSRPGHHEELLHGARLHGAGSPVTALGQQAETYTCHGSRTVAYLSAEFLRFAP